MKRHERRVLMERAAAATLAVSKMWGNLEVGIPLVARFYCDDPWISAGELAAGLDLSEDTVRRKLEALLRIGRVEAARRGRTTVYKAHRDYAGRTFEIVNRLVSDANCG